MKTAFLFIPPALAMLLVAAGCASTVASFYTLDMRASESAAASGVALGRVSLSDGLSSGNLAVRTSPTEIEYYHAAQWAGNLSEQLHEKLASELGAAHAEGDTTVADVTVFAFEQQDLSETEARAYTKMEVHFRHADMSRYDTPLHAATYEETEPLEGLDAASLAAALSRCVESTARRMAADAAALP